MAPVGSRAKAPGGKAYFAWDCSSENEGSSENHFGDRLSPASELGDRGEQALDVLRARQAVVAVLDEGEHDIVLGEP